MTTNGRPSSRARRTRSTRSRAKRTIEGTCVVNHADPERRVWVPNDLRGADLPDPLARGAVAEADEAPQLELEVAHRCGQSLVVMASGDRLANPTDGSKPLRCIEAGGSHRASWFTEHINTLKTIR